MRNLLSLRWLLRWQVWVRALAVTGLVTVIWPVVQEAISRTEIFLATPLSWLLVVADLLPLLFWYDPNRKMKSVGFVAWGIILTAGIWLTSPVLGLAASIGYCVGRVTLVALLMLVKD